MNLGQIDIRGLDPAELLARLYNEARPIGMGVLQDAARNGQPMDRLEAAELLREARGPHPCGGIRACFDYVFGRPIKLHFIYDGEEAVTLDGARLYDRDQGEGHCQRVVDSLRAEASS